MTAARCASMGQHADFNKVNVGDVSGAGRGDCASGATPEPTPIATIATMMISFPA